MTTPHNRAAPGELAPFILAPGDPLRAKLVAEKFLTGAKLVTDVRSITGYTGSYNGKPVSVMATGMGSPSAGIYLYEWFRFFNVQTVVRIGTCGGFRAGQSPGSLILAMTASTDSAWARQYKLDGTYSPCCDPGLFLKAVSVCGEKSIPFTAGMVFSSDLFSEYNAAGPDGWKPWAAMGAVAQDMETYAVYSTAAAAGRKAFSILTVTDNCVDGSSVPDDKRMECLYPMIETALALV